MSAPFRTLSTTVFALAALQLFLILPTQAATIQYLVSDLADVNPGEDLWRYDYAVSGRVFSQSELLDIYFDQNLFGFLTAGPPPNSDWDVLVLQQPSLINPPPFDVGIFDAAALTNNASLSGLFSVTFVYLGSGAPGAQPFDIFGVDFEIVESGVTSLPGAPAVPEPSTMALLLIGLTAAGIKFQRRSKIRSPRG